MSDPLIEQLENIVGKSGLLTGAAVADVEFPWDTHDHCHAAAIVYPMSTAEVSAILTACNAARRSVVPFGGLTNLVQGCATSEQDIVLSLARMNRIEELDASAQTLTAQSGVTLQSAQDAADAADLYFPVDIGARSNCMLGGIVSTNAGGSKVIRYGMTRDSVLGLEVVLADGTVLSSMNRYIKNNSGFDLKQLFVGSEGVLGIVTRVVFRLAVKPVTHNVALLGCDTFDNVVATLDAAKQKLPNTLTGFEVMWNNFYSMAVKPAGRLEAPLVPGTSFYVLLESMGADPDGDPRAFEAVLESLFESGLLSDGMLAKSDRERALIWSIRDEVEPVVSDAHNFDVSLKSADIGLYVDAVNAAVGSRFSDVEIISFGHLADNNIHLSAKIPGMAEDRVRAVEAIVYGELLPFDGAISAEHGIGLEKRPYLRISRTAEEVEMMRRLKTSLDPNNILNPGKVIDAA